jgi:hypothetical protein
MAAFSGSPTAQGILDELISTRRRLLAGNEPDANLLEANRRAIVYWSDRLTAGGKARRSAAEVGLRRPSAFGPVGQRSAPGTGTGSAR